MHLLEISIFSLNNAIFRLIKIMNRVDKNWAHFKKIKYFKNQSFQKMPLAKVVWSNIFQNFPNFRDVVDYPGRCDIVKKQLFPIDAYVVSCPTSTKNLEQYLLLVSLVQFCHLPMLPYLNVIFQMTQKN